MDVLSGTASPSEGARHAPPPDGGHGRRRPRIGVEAARLWPLGNALLGKVLGSRDFAALATEIRTIQPAETEVRSPAVVLPGQLERVRETDPAYFVHHPVFDGRTETTKCDGSPGLHQPVMAYTLRNVFVHRWGISVLGHNIRRFGQPSIGQLFDGPVTEIGSAAYCATNWSYRFFGNWLCENLPTTLLAEPDEPVIVPYRPSWAHAAEYLDILGVPVLPRGLHLVDRMTVYDDGGWGSSKRARARMVRTRLRERVTHRAGAGRRVYMRRGSAGEQRPILNEDELIATLTTLGFEVLDHEGRTARELVSILAETSVVVGPEGSQMNHAYCPMDEGGFALALVPPDRFLVSHAVFGSGSGIVPGIVVLEGSRVQGYRVTVPEVVETLRLAGAI